jgi:hypothetical protein
MKFAGALAMAAALFAAPRIGWIELHLILRQFGDRPRKVTTRHSAQSRCRRRPSISAPMREQFRRILMVAAELGVANRY